MSRHLELRPYQAYAKDFIIEHPACALWLDMGLGKSATTLSAIKDLMYDYYEVSKVLVIAPLRVAALTWPDEIQAWAELSDLRISTVLGSGKEREKALAADADIYTINFENLVWLVRRYRKDWPFDMVVIDESSAFKNHQAKRFKALRYVRPFISRLVELTGTPSPNGLMDLWSQIYLLDGGKRLEKTIGAYRRKYFTAGFGQGYVVYEWRLKDGADRAIYDAIKDICVSMKAKDYLSLPPVMQNVIKVKLPRPAMARYKQMERDLILSVDDEDIVASTAAALSNKLLQMAGGAVYDADGQVVELHRAKIDALAELLTLNTNKPIMVFYWFRADLDRLLKAFPQGRKLETVEDIREWNAGKIPLLFVHPASAGHGLNLQYGGNIAVWYSLTWSLELYEQANKRLHRSGQEHTVVVHHIVAEGTIDEQVMQALQDKKTGQDGMMEAIKARIKEYRGG